MWKVIFHCAMPQATSLGIFASQDYLLSYVAHVAKRLLQEAMQQAMPEVTLCLLRIIFIGGLASPSPVSAALTEDLVLGLLLCQQTGGNSNAEASLTRQGSYTEMQLGAPPPPEEVNFCSCQCQFASGSICSMWMPLLHLQILFCLWRL